MGPETGPEWDRNGTGDPAGLACCGASARRRRRPVASAQRASQRAPPLARFLWWGALALAERVTHLRHVADRADRHARRIACLLVRERRLVERAARLRRALDRALIAARREGVPHKIVAYAVQQASGAAATAEEIERLVSILRQRTKIAIRRVRRVRGAPAKVVAAASGARDNRGKEATTMIANPTLRRRIIEEYGPPDEALDGPPELLADDALGDEDGESDDESDDEDDE